MTGKCGNIVFSSNTAFIFQDGYVTQIEVVMMCLIVAERFVVKFDLMDVHICVICKLTKDIINFLEQIYHTK